MENPNNQFSMEEIRQVASLTPEQNLAIEQRKGTAPAFTPSIKADKIGTMPKVDIPQPTGQTTSSALNSLTFSTATPTVTTEQQATDDAKSFAQGQEQPLTALETQQQGLVDKAISAIEKLTGRSLRKQEVTEEQKIPEKLQAITDIDNEIAAMDREYELARRRIQDNADGKLRGAVDADLRVLQKDYLERKADKSLIKAAANSDLTTAYEIIDQKLDLEFGGAEDELKIRKEQLEIMKPLMDKEQAKQAQEFELFLGERERILTQQREDAKLLEQSKAQAIQLAASQNAPSSVLNAIKSATDMAGVWSAAGQYGGDILARQKQLLDIAKSQKELSKTTATGASDDPFLQSLLDTSGGKALTDTTIQKLDKGLTVLGQLGVLQANIENIKTGPIAGAFKGANPWDTEGQTIKAQLNAVVPNLARGIYGEVGVLTDNDIRTYSQTLPNLKSTEEIRNAVLYITLDMIGKSIKNTLSVNAAAGRDVSGFVDIYTEMENTKNSILSGIPNAGGGAVDYTATLDGLFEGLEPITIKPVTTK